jgi:gluconolactonase
MRLLPFALPLLLILTRSLFAAEPFDIKDKQEFARIVPPDAKVEKLATDMKFLEGPVWSAQDGGFLLFSDIPSNHINRWDAKTGLTVYREQSNNTNGNTRDGEGRLISCEHQARRVTRTEKDGTITVLAGTFDGKRFNSPNDVVVKSDGTIWFTDPPYGLPKGEQKELDKNFVFRLDPKTNQIKAVASDCDMPNGLAFSPDEKKLYVADSGKPRHIRVFDVSADGALTGGEVFCKIDNGAPDGIRVDPVGRLFSSAKDGVQIFSDKGDLIGKILLPESCANLCFGGKDRSELYMTASRSLYRIRSFIPISPAADLSWPSFSPTR